MSRRQLPRRSTRGQPPVRSQEQQEADNQFYSQLFGADALQESDQPAPEEIIKQQERQKRKQMLQKNFRGHNFARAHHYFFDLEQFARLQGHPSYAIDDQNVFKFTFSQEDKMINGQPLSQILNRKYFGLAVTHERHQEEEKTKNPCHEYLFEGEDRKYALQRPVITCKQILKHLQKLTESNKLADFQALIRKQPELQILNKQECSIELKAQLLQTKLQQFENKKEANKTNSEYLDRLLFYSSINQRLHDKINKVKGTINLSLIANTLVMNQWFYQRTIQEHPERLQDVLSQVLSYNLYQSTAISPGTINILATDYKPALTKVKDKEGLVILPCKIYSFGSHKLRELASRIINARVINTSKQMGFYSLKMAWARMFQIDLTLQKPILMKYEEYKNRMDSFISDAKNLKQQKQTYSTHKVYYLDQFINYQELTPQINKNTPIFKRRQAVIINDKELMLLSLYSYICKGLEQLLPLLESHNNTVELIASEFFRKHSLALIEATGSPFIGILDHCLDYFCQCISRPPPFSQFNYEIELQLDQQKGLGVIWKGAKQEDEWVSESQSDRREDSGEQIVADSIPKKKIKQI